MYIFVVPSAKYLQIVNVFVHKSLIRQMMNVQISDIFASAMFGMFKLASVPSASKC